MSLSKHNSVSTKKLTLLTEVPSVHINFNLNAETAGRLG